MYRKSIRPEEERQCTNKMLAEARQERERDIEREGARERESEGETDRHRHIPRRTRKESERDRSQRDRHGDRDENYRIADRHTEKEPPIVSHLAVLFVSPQGKERRVDEDSQHL